jgi:hypothetical protein
MRIDGFPPACVTWSKVSEYILNTPPSEGVHLVTSFYFPAYQKVNWLLFYCLCYVRTSGFTDPCCKEWDYGKLGEKYETSADGVLDALREFEKYTDTNMLPEEEGMLKLYNACVAYCQTEQHKPVPADPKPIPPEPIPEPPKPEPQPKPSEPAPATGTSWKTILKIVTPIILAAITAAGIFLPIPGWVKILVQTLLDALSSVIGG